MPIDICQTLAITISQEISAKRIRHWPTRAVKRVADIPPLVNIGGWPSGARALRRGRCRARSSLRPPEHRTLLALGRDAPAPLRQCRVQDRHAKLLSFQKRPGTCRRLARNLPALNKGQRVQHRAPDPNLQNRKSPAIGATDQCGSKSPTSPSKTTVMNAMHRTRAKPEASHRCHIQGLAQ